MNKFFTSKVAFNIVIAAAVVLVFLTQSGANSSALGVPAGRVLGDSTSAYAYPSGSVVNDQGTIYFLNGTVKIPFTNYAAFTGLGYSLKNVINGDLSNYTAAKTYFITTANDVHPWGSWLLYNGTVYYSQESGLIPISSWEVFLSNGGKANLIVNANSHDLAVLNANSNLPILTNNDTRIYSQQISGTIQDSYLPDNGREPDSSKNLVCDYAAAPAGYHYEGADTADACGRYLVKDTTANTPTPVISSLSTSTDLVGASVTITGSGFTSTGNTVNFGTGIIPNITSESGTSLSFAVPTGLTPACYYSTPPCFVATVITPAGNYNVSVTNVNGVSNSLNFTVIASSTTSSANQPPATTTPTTSNNPGLQMSCLYAPAPAGYHYEGADCSRYLVKDASSDTLTPTISLLTPSSGPVGTSVTITGSGFTSTGNTVYFASTRLTNISSSNGTSLTFTVPTGITPGCYYSSPPCGLATTITTPGSYDVSVANANGTSNTVSFTVN